MLLVLLMIALCVVVHSHEEFDVRLAGSVSSHNGRVEVFYNGHWRTLCDRDWSFNEASTVCRQLGLPSTGAAPIGYAFFGEGSGPIWTSNVECETSAEALVDCDYFMQWEDCDHGEDVCVICSEEAESQLESAPTTNPYPVTGNHAVFNAGSIIGSVAGGVILLLILLFVLAFFLRTKRCDKNNTALRQPEVEADGYADYKRNNDGQESCYAEPEKISVRKSSGHDASTTVHSYQNPTEIGLNDKDERDDQDEYDYAYADDVSKVVACKKGQNVNEVEYVNSSVLPKKTHSPAGV